MIAFTVYGTPRPQGSTRAFVPKGWKRPIITSDNKKLKPWRQQVSETALAVRGEYRAPPSGPVAVVVAFYFARPKSAKKRVGMTVRPDADKLVRSVLDSLTGICYRDDAQVVRIEAEKHYGDPERVEIRVEAL